MASQSGLHGYLCCFLIADFTHHYNVRILTQERTQRVRECKSDLWFNLNLVYSLQLIFDRIFHRQDFGVSAVQMT